MDSHILDAYSAFILGSVHRLKMNYNQLQEFGLDTGFTSATKDGKDIHLITREIAISFMHFQNGLLSNMMFAQGLPVYLDYDDEIAAYYSDYIEIRYILNGTLVVEFENKTVEFHEGEICFINSMAYHRESIPQSHCLLLNVSVQKEFFTEAFLNSVTLTPLKKFLRKNIMRHSDEQHYLRFKPDTANQANQFQNYLYQILTEAVTQKAGYLEISKGYIIRLMCELSEWYHFDFNEEESKQYSQKLYDAVTDYIKANLQTISMSMLTEEFHYQPNYFNLLIRKHSGMTYSDYLIFVRMERAKHYLSTTDISIDEIMWMVGYNNKGFFYRKFRDHTGITPSHYRRGIKK